MMRRIMATRHSLITNPLGGDRPLSRVSRYTARFHIPAAALEGLVAGVFTMNDIVLRKTFGASALLITLVVMAPPVSQLLAIVWGNLMEGRKKRPFILGFGGAGRLALLAVAFATTPIAFSIPIIFSITMATAIIPALNALYQTNYPNVERGRVYGWVMSATALATIVGSVGAGALMDWNHESYRLIYPVCGLVGLGAAFLFYRIRARRAALRARVERRAKAFGRLARAVPFFQIDWLDDVQRALRNPLRGARTIYASDPAFLKFEIAFMIYGLAFMLMQPVIPIFLVDEIKVQYSQAATARGLIFYGVVAILSPYFGRMLDQWNAVRLSMIGFLILAFFPVGMALSRSVPAVYLSFAIYGVGMTAVNIAWTMGPILFAGHRDAAAYMGVHVTMVGIRGLVGNPMGLFLLSTVGSRVTFLVAGALFLAATGLMMRLGRAMKHDPRLQQAVAVSAT
jgi:MFS family permease